MTEPASILCFAPYANWSYHSAYEAMLMHALRMRGARTQLVICDGLFGACDIHQPAKRPRQHDSCLNCQANAAGLMARWKMDYTWLSRYLSSDLPQSARAWAQQLSSEDLAKAHYRDHLLAPLIASSLGAGFRDASPDRTNPVIARHERELVAGALMTMAAMDRMIEQFQPDALLLFNGRMGYTRAALEIAREKDIPVLVHERGIGPQIRFSWNEDCNRYRTTADIYRAWRDLPLSAPEIAYCDRFLRDRMQGQGFVAYSFNAGDDGGDIRSRLDLDAHAPLIVAFTTATDEIGADFDATRELPDHASWINALLAYAARRADVQIVLRVHPNTGSARSIGRNTREIAFFEDVATRLPKNVTLIPATSDISAFSLIRAADAVTTWMSTTGLEASMLGRPVIQAAAMPDTGDIPFLNLLRDDDRLDDAIQRALQPRNREEMIARARMAWRYVYVSFQRQTIDLPMIRHDQWHIGDFNFANTQELLPGRDAGLDRTCNILLGREDYIPTTEGHRGDAEREGAAIRGLIDTFGWPRNMADTAGTRGALKRPFEHSGMTDPAGQDASALAPENRTGA